MMSGGIIHREIEIDEPVAEVWPLVATEDGLRQWWGSEITLEPQEGGHCAERMVVQGREVVHHGIVSVYAPPHRLTLTFSPATGAHAATAEAWSVPSRVSITLEEVAARTRVAVVHHVLSAALPAATHATEAAPSASFGPRMGLPAAVMPIPSQPPSRAGTLRRLDLQQQWEARLRRLAARAGEEESA